MHRPGYNIFTHRVLPEQHGSRPKRITDLPNRISSRAEFLQTSIGTIPSTYDTDGPHIPNIQGRDTQCAPRTVFWRKGGRAEDGFQQTAGARAEDGFQTEGGRAEDGFQTGRFSDRERWRRGRFLDRGPVPKCACVCITYLFERVLKVSKLKLL